MESKFTFPNDRPWDFFNIGEKIVVYLDLTYDDSKPIPDGLSEKDSGWYTGNVQHGYRHHDGCVSYRMDGIGPQGDEDDFSGYWGSGSSWPGIMKAEEFSYFSKHPKEYIKYWDEAMKHNYSKNWKYYPINENDLALMAKNLLLDCSPDEQLD